MESREQIPAESAGQVPVLPQGAILSYFNVNNASRVRQVAVWGMFAAGGLALAEFLWLAYAVLPSRLPGVRSFGDLVYLVEAMVREDLFLSLILGAFLIEAVVLVLCGWGVKRFSQAAAVTGIIALVPLIASTVLMSVGFLMAALLEGSGFMSGPVHRVYLFYGIPGLAGIVVVLLLKDLAAFLLWIFRHPGAEKPPVPFLPGMSSR